jgi:hypothetical protein
VSDLKELKDLSWAVQTEIAGPGFDTLVRRAHRRRIRTRAIAATSTAAAAIAIAALLTGGPIHDATPDPVDGPRIQTFQDVLAADLARVDSVRLVPGGGLLASWSGCTHDGTQCKQATVSSDTRGVVTGPLTDHQWIPGGDDRYAVLLDGLDPAAGTARAVLLSPAGQSVVTLTWQPPTSTVTADAVPVRNEFGPLLVDPGLRTIRRLWPDKDLIGKPFGMVVRDHTGTIWLTVGPADDRVRLMRSADGGQTWTSTEQAGDVGATTIAVSPDGRTVAFATRTAGGTLSTVRISRDAGRTWTAVPQPLDEHGLAAFDDGMVLAYGSLSSTPERTAYKIGSDLRLTQIPAVPALDRLEVAGDTLYGRSGDEALTSADRGAHWTRVELR